MLRSMSFMLHADSSEDFSFPTALIVCVPLHAWYSTEMTACCDCFSDLCRRISIFAPLVTRVLCTCCANAVSRRYEKLNAFHVLPSMAVIIAHQLHFCIIVYIQFTLPCLITVQHFFALYIIITIIAFYILFSILHSMLLVSYYFISYFNCFRLFTTW